MHIEQFNFSLPDELIAQYPTPVRSQSRLLIYSPCTINNELFVNLAQYIDSKDLLVLNDTKVLKARLYGKKDTGGVIECLIERIIGHKEALVQIRANKSPKIGTDLYFDNYTATVLERAMPFYKLSFNYDILLILEKCGHLPLPPYIKREDSEQDELRYQTIFAKNLGAVAAPTASLHFDDIVINSLNNKNIKYDYLTLHVGSGTFMPVKTEDINKHVMHTEPYCISNSLIKSIENTKKNGGRIIAVGTTALRALESAYNKDKIEKPFGDTNIFIKPGYDFNIVDGLITNFHLPKSTLLMLVAAFVGFEEMKTIYAHAVEHKYRFFSYGDSMLCWRKQ